MDQAPNVQRVLRQHHNTGIVFLIVSAVMLVILTCISVYFFIINPLDDNALVVFISAISFPFVAVFWQRYHAAKSVYQNTPITAEQFPEIHSIIVELSQQAGLEQVPPASLTKDPALNPCSTNPGIRRGIIIGVEAVAGCREQNTPEALRFLIAHQIGHFVAGHHTKRWNILSAPCMGTLGLRTLVTRHLEFTADAYATQLCCDGAHQGLALLAIGKDNFAYVDRDIQIRAASSQKSWLSHIARWTVTEVAPTERVWRLQKDGLIP